jgi:hypothetical protein
MERQVKDLLARYHKSARLLNAAADDGTLAPIVRERLAHVVANLDEHDSREVSSLMDDALAHNGLPGALRPKH